MRRGFTSDRFALSRTIQEFYGQSRGLKETVEANIGMICVGTDQRSSRQAVELPRIMSLRAAGGVHPHDTKDGWGDVETLLENKTKNSPVAIGELGSGVYNNSPRETQIEGLGSATSNGG